MISAYKTLESDTELNYLLDNVNYNMNHTQNFERVTSGINYTICCHGKHHTAFVVGAIEYILRSLSYDEHTVELGKIAGLLHDIGNFFGRNDHATMSASMCLYFISKTNLNLNDLNIIKQAVLDHSKGMEIQSAAGAALIIADKMTDRKRSIHLKEDMIRCGFDNEAELNKNDKPLGFLYPYNITDVKFNIVDRDLIFNFFVEGDIELFMKEYFVKKLKSMPIILTRNAVAFLNCNCIYEVNGDEIDIM